LVRTGTVDENDFEKTFETFQLFYQTWAENRFSFTYTWFGGQPLRYARYLTIEQIKDENAVLPSDKLLKISSHVLFKKSGLTGDTVMESFIWNYDIGW
jgi:hypothetical protein